MTQTLYPFRDDEPRLPRRPAGGGPGQVYYGEELRRLLANPVEPSNIARLHLWWEQVKDRYIYSLVLAWCVVFAMFTAALIVL